jgi:hypothetical protein
VLPKRWECRFSVPKFKKISASIPPDLHSLESVPLTFWDRLTPLLRFLGYFYLHILVSAINLLNLVVFVIIIDIRHCNSRHVRSSAIYGTKDVTSIIRDQSSHCILLEASLTLTQSRSQSLRSSGRNARLWDNPLPEARNRG